MQVLLVVSKVTSGIAAVDLCGQREACMGNI